jgi:excisionase family DNA binding protein
VNVNKETKSVDNFQILTAKELAAVFKVSERTIARQVRKGLIPGIRVGAGRRFLLNEVWDAMAKESRKS